MSDRHLASIPLLTLESLAAWCLEEARQASHGSTLEDAGRASAFARVAAIIFGQLDAKAGE